MYDITGCLWKAYQRSSIPRWFAPATTGTREAITLLSPSVGVESGGIHDYAYPSTGVVHAQGAVTAPWQLLSLLAGTVATPLAQSMEGRGLTISELEPDSWRLGRLEEKLCLDSVFKREANVDSRFPRRYAFGNVRCFADGLLHFVLFGTYLACLTSFLK